MHLCIPPLNLFQECIQTNEGLRISLAINSNEKNQIESPNLFQRIHTRLIIKHRHPTNKTSILVVD